MSQRTKEEMNGERISTTVENRIVVTLVVGNVCEDYRYDGLVNAMQFWFKFGKVKTGNEAKMFLFENFKFDWM